MLLPEKKESAHGKTRSALENHSVPAIYSGGAPLATVELQVARLTQRFRLPPPTARLIAGLAFDTGRPA